MDPYINSSSHIYYVISHCGSFGVSGTVAISSMYRCSLFQFRVT